jgi:hypothetical protein
MTNMPKHLLAACIAYLASRGGMAALAPFFETGVAKWTSPILMCLLMAIVVLFMRRYAWTWGYIQCIAIAEIAINALFFPTPEFQGAYTDLARLLAAAIIGTSSVILWSIIRRPDTKAWFLQR